MSEEALTGRTTSESFMDEFGLPDRSEKPRIDDPSKGLTIAKAHIPEDILEIYGDYIDVVKCLTKTVMFHPEDKLREKIKLYHDHDIKVQLAGSPVVFSRVQGREEEMFEKAKEFGFDMVEYDTNVAEASYAEIKDDIEELKSRGFGVVGEVGAKWWHKDETRRSRTDLKVDETIEAMNMFLDAGVDILLWEGILIRCVVGRDLDNESGIAAFKKVVDAVGSEHITFELSSPDYRPRDPQTLIAWLIHHYGPEINIASVSPGKMKDFEKLRRGISLDMNFPYTRWLKEGKPTEDWWRVEMPPYPAVPRNPYPPHNQTEEF